MEDQTHPDGGPLHGGEGDPLGEGIEESTDQDAGSGGDEGKGQPPLPDDEPKPGL